jgi:peptide/nickel transport system substrate-binding protein
MQEAGFPGSPASATLWRAVDIEEISPTEIAFTLPEPYSPFLDATTRGIVPAHLLQDVAAAELEDAPFNAAPVGTGPFMIYSGQDPQRNHRLRLSPNPVHWRHGIKLASVEFRFFSDDRALLESFAAGEIQAINNVSHGILPEIAAIADVRLFSASLPRLTVLLFNMPWIGMR